MEAGFFNSLITMTLITGRYSSNIEYIICFLERMRFQILFIYSIEKMKKNRRNGFLTIYISLFGDRYSW